ncbi:MAG: lipopolysaccharide heptosyltransferase II [Candidatus Omnitrophota bacterium]|jgi:heptosyltransferase-2
MKKKILLITLSNIGDVILTLPAIDSLKAGFPQSHITVLASEKVRDIFAGNPFVDKFIIYDKRAKLKEKIKLFLVLIKNNFDLVVDLKDSFLGFILRAQSKHLSFAKIPKKITHMKERHLYLAGHKTNDVLSKSSLYIGHEDEEHIRRLLKSHGISDKDNFIVISAGARSHTKRWPKEKFAELASKLKEEFGVKVVLVGAKEDEAVNKYINENLKGSCLDLSAKTNLRELASLLKKASLVVSNDSATMHMASYLDIPVVAIFGITDDSKYGPWSKKSIVVKKEINCRPCKKAQCKLGTLDCLRLIKVEDVLRAAREALTGTQREDSGSAILGNDNFKRILIVRTDRIGDVLLSTPVIKAVREKYPQAFIAVMVSSYAKDIVEGNPYLDEVIIYDKAGKHKSWLRSIKFARNLDKKRFDLAIILHPTNRAHLLTFLAGIPKRVGYDRKLGFLLTDRFAHTKERGEKHELEYNLDLLRDLEIRAEDKNLFMPIKKESEEWANDFFKREGIKADDKLLAINPAASCPSKVWPPERFAKVADKLAQKYGFKILLVSSSKDLLIAQCVIKNMRSSVISLAGKTSLSQLASLLKRCSFFISNDSGPVHIASSVGTPVISIFGRKQNGLSPKRWGPVGAKDKVLHKDIGCIECLAHNCQKQFACLKAISVEDVVSCADSILKG